MYKLNIDHLTEVKYENTPQHGLFSGTIETDRVVLVDGDGKYLQTDGNFGTDLKNGLVRTWSATRDEAETTYLIATTSATTTAAVFCYADAIALQSTFSNSVDAFIEYLVDELHLITIDDYENPKYQLATATVKTAGSGYTDASIDVTVPGQTGDTAGVVTVTITEGACSAATIKTAGSYETMVASQDLTVGTGNGKITVTMEEISAEGDAKGPSRSEPVEDDKSESESKEEEPEVVEEPKSTKKGQKSAEPEPEPEVEPKSEPESEPEVEQEVEQPAEQPEPEPESEPETK